MNGLLEVVFVVVLMLVDVVVEKKQVLKGKQISVVQKFFVKFVIIFMLLIFGFIVVGLLLGFVILVEQVFVLENVYLNVSLVVLIGYMKVFSKGMFIFLSILIGYNVQKVFGGFGVNGVIIVLLFVLGYNLEVISGFYVGIFIFFGYGIDLCGNIIGVLIVVIFGVWVECQVWWVMLVNFDMIFILVVMLLIMGVVIFMVIMLIGGWLFIGMLWLFLYFNGNLFGLVVLVGLFLLVVMFGVYQGFVLVYFVLVDVQGFNLLFLILVMVGVGQVGVVLVLFWWVKCDLLL